MVRSPPDMYTYKLTQLAFNDETTFTPGKLTVIVGPNNAGKSRALRDIATLVTNPDKSPSVIVKGVEWTEPQSLEELFQSYPVEPLRDKQSGGWVRYGINHFLHDGSITGIGEGWRMGYERSLHEPRSFAFNFGSEMLAFLTTEHRLQLVTASASPEYERTRKSLLQLVYFEGKALENQIKQVVKSAFGKDIILDYTLLSRLCFRVGDDFSTIPVDPRDARPILERSELLDDQGDGIRSFVAIVVAFLATTKRSLVLIDEPEAFLHPPQAFRIGEFLADQSNDRRQLVLATHSADVLRGILAKTRDVSILRLDRTGDKNYFRVLDPERVKSLVNDPLLSSARVLDGLFYSGAVVVEGESDGRFYHAVSKRRRPDADLHFVNADNKQTVPKIAEMYREMGVRCAGIVDFDALNDGAEFRKQLDALALDDAKTKEASDIRQKIAEAAQERSPEEKLEHVKTEISKLLSDITTQQGQAFNSDAEALSARARFLRQVENKCRELANWTKNWRTLKEKGRTALPENIQVEFDRLWQICAGNGLFINPCGELESMLTEYGIQYTTDKRAWIIQALQLLPNLEVNDQKQPWMFVKAIHEHIGQS